MSNDDRRLITISACVNCGGDAGLRPYLNARTELRSFRYRVCTRCMEKLSAALSGPNAAETLLEQFFGRIIERTIGRNGGDRAPQLSRGPCTTRLSAGALGASTSDQLQLDATERAETRSLMAIDRA